MKRLTAVLAGCGEDGPSQVPTVPPATSAELPEGDSYEG